MNSEDQPTILTAPPNGSRHMSTGWQAPTVDQMQAMLPQYEIMEILGRGGMGAVYKARQKSLKRLVAIKILPLGMADDGFKFAERFQNEAQTMAAMNHPAIVSVYDFGETADGLLYFIMEFVDGTDVQKMIQASGRLSGEHALAISAHVCDALAYAHSRGVIHRDIKPANILIDQEGHIKVADFGLAKMHDPSQTSGLTKTNMAMGTPDYVAPEVLSPGMVADHRADLYAVGVMLYQMLTGEVPRGMFKLPSEKGVGSDPRFDEIICKAMEQDREERYQSALDVRHALDEIRTTPLAKDEGTVVLPVQQTNDAGRSARSLGTWLGIGAIAAALGVAGVFISSNTPKQQTSPITDNISAKSQPATRTGKTIDLLALVDVTRDAIAGEWSRDGGDLLVKAAKPGTKGTPRLQVPYQPPEEYDFEIEFTPESGTNLVAQVLSAHQHSFAWMMDVNLNAGMKAGFDRIEGQLISGRTNGTTMRTKFLTNGQRHRSTVEVRKTGVRSLLDDELLITYGKSESAFQALDISPSEALRDGLHLGLVAYDRSVRFHKLTVREITGTGKVDAPQASDVAVKSNSSGTWTDWLGPKLAAGAYNSDGWVRLQDGLTTEREINGIRLLPPGTKDAAVRVTYILQDSEGLMVNARERMEGKVRLAYSALDKITRLHLDRLKPDGRHAPLQHVILPVEVDRMAERTLEFRILGNQILARLNGSFVGTAADDTLSEGEWTLVFMKGVLVKKVEVQTLDSKH